METLEFVAYVVAVFSGSFCASWMFWEWTRGEGLGDDWEEDENESE